MIAQFGHTVPDATRCFTCTNNVGSYPWSSLVEGDEQLDRPNSQTTMELCHARVA